MKAEEFQRNWQNYVIKLSEEKELLSLYNSYSKWTKEVQDNVFNRSYHWSSHFDRTRTEFRKQDWSYLLPLNGKIESMHEDANIINASEFHTRVVIEFENSIESCWEEMIKLTQLRANLKILVTYDYDHKGNPDNTYIERARENFKEIIYNAGQLLPELDAEYLLIVGQLCFTTGVPRLEWHYSKYDVNAINPMPFK